MNAMTVCIVVDQDSQSEMLVGANDGSNLAVLVILMLLQHAA